MKKLITKEKSFKSRVEASKYYGIKYRTIMDRLNRQKISDENCIIPVRNYSPHECVDTKGDVYSTHKKMAISHNVEYRQYLDRKNRRKLPLEKCLYSGDLRKKIVKDYKGIEYPCMKDMCEAYHITNKLLNIRLKRNFSLERALTEPVHKYVKKDNSNKERRAD